MFARNAQIRTPNCPRHRRPHRRRLSAAAAAATMLVESLSGMVAISPKSGVCIPPKVFCSVWRYFEVSEQSQVSVRIGIEEAFQIHTNTRKIPITKKTKYRPGIGLAIPVSRYRSGDTSLTGIGLAIPVSRYRSGDTRNPRVGEGGGPFHGS